MFPRGESRIVGKNEDTRKPPRTHTDALSREKAVFRCVGEQQISRCPVNLARNPCQAILDNHQCGCKRSGFLETTVESAPRLCRGIEGSLADTALDVRERGVTADWRCVRCARAENLSRCKEKRAHAFSPSTGGSVNFSTHLNHFVCYSTKSCNFADAFLCCF